MKICAVICEYNPFHNGHRYQLSEIRRLSGCDRIVCFMSGNFTQRGEAAVFHKFVRAKHAVECGADAVIELPTAFAVSPAELFAQGAIHLIASLPTVDKLAFGCESGTREDFIAAARATLGEDGQFKSALKEKLKEGTSYIRARNELVLALNSDVDENLLSAPNNILGVEYCRALILNKSAIEPLPIPRVGGGYADTSLFKDFSSATALRAALSDGSRKARKALKRNLPPEVFETAESYAPLAYKEAALCALLRARGDDIALCPDCSEGLQNRLLALAGSNPSYDEMLKKAVSKRYTLSRCKRILLQNFLGIHGKDVKDYVQSPLYLKVLALKKECSDELLAAFGESKFPAVVRKSDYSLLKKDAHACFERDVVANELYNALSGIYTNPYETLFV